MALVNYLSQIKSSGLYRFTWDKSQMTPEKAQTMRLLVGYSEKGPFNTPVYINSKSEFKNIFGDINKKLERFGAFFHRNSLQALDAGPIYVINLKNISTEKIDSLSLHTQLSGNPTTTSTSTLTKQTQTLNFKDIYNTDRFWTLEPKKLESLESDKYITLCATGDKKTSNTIVIRKITPSGYNITFAEWYNTVLNGETLPEYMGDGTQKLQDYFGEIYVFKGNLTGFTDTNLVPESLNQYFELDNNTYKIKTTIQNSFGESIDALEALSKNQNSGFINKYSGILLPEFQASNGTPLSLDTIFNNDNTIHNMMININKSLLYNGTYKLQYITLPTVTAADFHNFSYFLEGYTYNYSAPNFGDIFYPQTLPTNTSINISSISSSDTTITTTVALGNDIISFNYGEIEIGTDTYELNNGTLIISTTDTNSGGQDIFTGNVSCNVTESNGDIIGTLVCNIVGYYVITDGECTLDNMTFSNIIFTNYSDNTTPSKSYAKWNWINNCSLNSLLTYKGLRIGLTSRIDLEYHYLVDTWESYYDLNTDTLDTSTYNLDEIKSKLAFIAKEKDNTLALLNFPSIDEFYKCKDSNTNIINFNTAISSVNHPLKLASETNGASWCSYHTCITLNDSIRKTTCPSAALVSNNYMAKYITRHPYSIVAGPNYGNIINPQLIGPDYNFSREDLDILEPFGVNCMVYAPRRGTYINSNQTAKQNPVTALSKVSTRELVIFIQDEIENLLRNYQWEFNTQALRNTIKAKADVILETIKNNGGIYFYINICDESNNIDDVINNEMLVLSTSIEPGIGAGKMVQELTIYRKGGMSSSIIE